jgi:hypothetical protein
MEASISNIRPKRYLRFLKHSGLDLAPEGPAMLSLSPLSLWDEPVFALGRIRNISQFQNSPKCRDRMKTVVELARAGWQVMRIAQRQQLASFAIFDSGFAPHDQL